MFTYDLMDGLTRVDYPDGNYVSYSYDNACRLTKVTTPFGSTSSYEYDLLDRLTRVVDRNGYATVYEYDANGNRTAVHYANGFTTTYEYDLLNRLICEKTVDSKDNVVVQYIYTLGVAGERKSVTELDRTVEYSYDSLYRLTSEIITEGEKVTVYTYAYDNVSNRILKTENGEETVYTYNALNQLVSENDIVYEYDLNGNTVRMTSPSKSALYVYNAENRLVRATVQSGNNVSVEEYKYDYAGNRIAKSSEGEYTKYLLDINGELTYVLAEMNFDNTEKCYYTRGDELISQERDGKKSYYVYDGHGSVRSLADESGNVTDKYVYDAFGNLISSVGSTKNDFLFCGEQFDPVTGLYYLRARYMNPSVGRFITMDSYEGSISDPISLHKYLYANANPVMYSDPSGYTSLGEMVCVSAAISGICMATINAAAYLDGLVSINDFNIWDFGNAIIEGFLAGVCIGALFGIVSFYAMAIPIVYPALASVFKVLSIASGIVGTFISLCQGIVELKNHNYFTAVAFLCLGMISLLALAAGLCSASNYGATESSSSTSFYTVQSEADEFRLLNGGTPWPTEDSRAALGEGVYAWETRAEAEKYLQSIIKRDPSARIVEFSVNLDNLKSLNIDALPQDQIDIFMMRYSRLYGGTPNHGYDHLQRGTNYGVEHYFSYLIYELLNFK